MRSQSHSIISRSALIIAFGLGAAVLVAAPAGASHFNCRPDSSEAHVDEGDDENDETEMITDTPPPCGVADEGGGGFGAGGRDTGGRGPGAVPTRIDAGAGGAGAGAGNAVAATAAAGAVALAVAGHRVLRRRRY